MKQYIALYVKQLKSTTRKAAEEEALNNVPHGCMFYEVKEE